MGSTDGVALGVSERVTAGDGEDSSAKSLL
jgi:hypothetical protein